MGFSFLKLLFGAAAMQAPAASSTAPSAGLALTAIGMPDRAISAAAL